MGQGVWVVGLGPVVAVVKTLAAAAGRVRVERILKKAIEGEVGLWEKIRIFCSVQVLLEP